MNASMAPYFGGGQLEPEWGPLHGARGHLRLLLHAIACQPVKAGRQLL